MSKSIILEEKKFTTQIIGRVRKEILDALDLTVSREEIVIYPGAIRHIKKRHPHAFRLYFKKIPEVIESPDFIGMSSQNPKRIEIVKKYKENILVALKVDENHNLFVSSMYIIEDSRIEKRVEYGRLIPVKLIDDIPDKKQKYKNTVRCARY